MNPCIAAPVFAFFTNEFFQYLDEDACGGLCCAAVLMTLGSMAVNREEKLRMVGAAFAGIVLLATFWYRVPRNPWDFTGLAMACFSRAGVMLGSAWIILPILAWPVRWMVALHRRTLAEKKQWEEQERRRLEESRRIAEQARQAPPPPAPLPPPPTREELAAAARQRYADKLRMLESIGLDETELASAREQAKQRYLYEIDEIMK